RHRVLSVGRPVRPQGHTGADRVQDPRLHAGGRDDSQVQGTDGEYRPGRRLSRSGRVPGVLGCRWQARGGRGAVDRTGGGAGQMTGIKYQSSKDTSSLPSSDLGHLSSDICQPMTLRADHVAGGAAIAAALAVLGVSGDLPFGTLAFPGAGMMPKLVCALMIMF